MTKDYLLTICDGTAVGDTRATIGAEPFHASWEWDGRTLTLKTDRFGLQQVFYRQTEKSFAVSTTIDGLRQPDEAFDWGALGLFLRLGFYIDNDTPYREIRLAPADSILRWQDRALTIEARQRPQVRPYVGTRQQAKDIYIELFREGVKGLLDAYQGVPISCPLSGGRDSRHIFLELSRLGTPFRAFTVALDNANDDSIAAALCAQFNVAHTIVPMGRPSLQTARAMQSGTNYATIEHRWMVGMAETIQGGVVFDGVAGDVLSAGHFATERMLSQFRRHKLEELADDLLKAEDGLRNLLQPWLYANVTRADAKERLVQELARHGDNPSPIASFFLANRTRRVASLMATTVFKHCQGLMPFFLDPVYDFLFALPGEMTVDHKLHSETLSQAFPECTHPYSEKHAPASQRALMAEALAASAEWRKIVDMGFLRKRLSRGIVQGSYSARSAWLVDIPCYLHHVGVGRS